jgi:hypothetical protein
MSAYVTVQTVYKDVECLLAALREMGYQPEHVPEGGRNLVGYHGDERPERAHVIIPRSQLSSSANDVGWERQPDGSYAAHISQYDGRNTFPARSQRELSQRYAKSKTIKMAKSKGYSVTEEKTDNGSIKLKLRRY